MRHAEVVNCFHELGHAIANILCRRQYSGSAKLAPDFTEVPSIFLEYFFWDPNIIRALSSHYTDPTGQSRIPDDLIEHLIEARDFNAALQPLVLLAQSLFDLEIHSPPNAETLKSMNLAVTFNTIRKEVLMLKGPEDLGYGYEALHGYSHFRAIIGNYDACYYTYLTYVTSHSSSLTPFVEEWHHSKGSIGRICIRGRFSLTRQDRGPHVIMIFQDFVTLYIAFRTDFGN